MQIRLPNYQNVNKFTLDMEPNNNNNNNNNNKNNSIIVIIIIMSIQSPTYQSTDNSALHINIWNSIIIIKVP